MLSRLVATVSALVLTALAVPASASMVFAYDLPRLVSASEQVVDARVTRTLPRYQGSQIVTEVEVVVRAAGKGSARAGEVLTFVVLGGTVGDVVMRVEGAPRLAPGDEAVLFLGRHSSGALTTVGLSQGVLPIRDAGGIRQAHPGGAGLVLVRRDASGRPVPGSPAIESPVAVDALLGQVRSLDGSPR